MNSWTQHGHPPASPGVLPRSGIHFLIGPEKSGKSSIAADLAITLAAGDAGCGLIAPDKSGVRISLSGFFGKPTGASVGVAIVAEALAPAEERKVEAAE